MPTATGLPKAGDQVYNAHFKQRFRVMGRSSNSFPMTIYIRPMPGKDFPADLIRAHRRMPDGTFPLPLEVPMDDAFRMGLSHWTNLPDQGEIEPGRIVQCERKDTHSAHLYLRNRVWHKCHGQRNANPPREGTPGPADRPARKTAAQIQAEDEDAFFAWYSEHLAPSLTDEERAAERESEWYAEQMIAFLAGVQYERGKKGV